MNHPIEHKAIVENVEPQWVDVVMQVESACGACKARHICGSGEEGERRITIHTPEAGDYSVGERVVVYIERTMGFKAVALAYIYPFVLMLAVLLGSLELGAGELTAGLASLGALAAYYLVLYLSRGKIEKEVVFKIGKEQ